jgi:hypothetical protein
MAHIAHSDWTFEHSVTHVSDPLIDIHADPTAASIPTLAHSDSVASVIKTLWQQSDTTNGGAAHSRWAPSPLKAADTVTVDSPGSVALPVNLTQFGQKHAASVTITGLTDYESITDNADNQVFTGNSVTLSAEEVKSGLTLWSNYTGTGHPVNDLALTATGSFHGATYTSAPTTIKVIDPPVATASGGSGTSSSNPLTLVVTGDNMHGTDPQIQLLVDGTQVGGTYTITADHAQGQTQTIQVAGNFDPTVAHDVQVRFLNDNWDGQLGDGHDVNVYVESVSLNGATIVGARGTNNAMAGGAAPSNPDEAVMYVNGGIDFHVPADAPATGGTIAGSNGAGPTATGGGNSGAIGNGTPGGSGTTGGNPLILAVAGDNMHGADPQIQVLVDGTQVGGTYTITADHAQGQTQTIQVAGNFDPTVTHDVRIRFINDNWDGQLGDGHDINVYVESISLNGSTITGAQGANNAMAGGAPTSNPNEAVMYVNGTIDFHVPADPPAGAIATGTSGSGATTSSVGTSAGAGGGVAIGTGAGQPPSGPGFYVSPNGSDSNPGTVDAPFATLARAQQAMENSSIKATYVEGGTYNLSGGGLTLTGADSGETWQYYPSNGVDSAVLDGGTAAADGFNISGATNVTINGLKLQNFTQFSIIVWPGGDGAVIENNDVGSMTVAPPVEMASSVAGIASGSPNVSILHNYVHDVASIGIAASAWGAGQSVDGDVISGNVVLRAAQQSDDNGAIYVNMANTGDSGGHVSITNNFVSGTGGAGHTSLQDIYLDDNASNVTIAGNVLGPFAPGVSNGNEISNVYFHNGNNNTVTGNIIDLGSSSFQVPVTYGYDSGSSNGMANNVFDGNIILSKFTGDLHSALGPAYFEGAGPGLQASWFTIDHNLYWNYAAGGSVFTNGTLVGDAHPVTGVNPQISGPTYTVAGGSPVFGNPVNFAGIVGGWGPSGFVVPNDGLSSV